MHFLKVIQQSFRKDVNLNRFLKGCPVYNVLIMFSSRHVFETDLLIYKKSNLFVYKFVVNC